MRNLCGDGKEDEYVGYDDDDDDEEEENDVYGDILPVGQGILNWVDVHCCPRGRTS